MPCSRASKQKQGRGWHILLTALQSVWYHFAPQALRLQLCWLRGRSREEHSYGGMTVNPSSDSDFIRHTTDLCWLPAPHSAEHWLTYKNSINHMDLITHWNILYREWKNYPVTSQFKVTVKPLVLSCSRQLPLKPTVTFCHPHTWFQGPVYHSMRFSQGPLLQTWESAGRSLPHPSRGRLPTWLVKQRIPRVRTPIPHSAEHYGVNTHFTLHVFYWAATDWQTTLFLFGNLCLQHFKTPLATFICVQNT